MSRGQQLLRTKLANANKERSEFFWLLMGIVKEQGGQVFVSNETVKDLGRTSKLASRYDAERGGFVIEIEAQQPTQDGSEANDATIGIATPTDSESRLQEREHQETHQD